MVLFLPLWTCVRTKVSICRSLPSTFTSGVPRLRPGSSSFSTLLQGYSIYRFCCDCSLCWWDGAVSPNTSRIQIFSLTWMPNRLRPGIDLNVSFNVWNMSTIDSVIIPVLSFSKLMELSSNGALQLGTFGLFSLWIGFRIFILNIYSLSLLALSTSVRSWLTIIDSLLSLFVIFMSHLSRLAYYSAS